MYVFQDFVFENDTVAIIRAGNAAGVLIVKT